MDELLNRRAAQLRERSRGDFPTPTQGADELSMPRPTRVLMPTTCRLHDGGLRVKATSFSILTIMVRTERSKTPMRAGIRNRDKYVASGVLELAPVGTPAYARAFMVWNGRKWQKKHQSLLCGGFALSGLDVSYAKKRQKQKLSVCHPPQADREPPRAKTTNRAFFTTRRQFQIGDHHFATFFTSRPTVQVSGRDWVIGGGGGLISAVRSFLLCLTHGVCEL